MPRGRLLALAGSWRHAVAIGALALASAACTRDQNQEERELSAVPPRPPAPRPEAENPAPLNQYEAPGRKDDVRVAAERGESTVIEVGEVEAEAHFTPVLDEDLRGRATLEMVGDAVQVELKVSGAPAGSQPVVIRPSGPCTESTKREPAAEQRIGDLQVGADQRGQLQARVRGASLEPREKGTLLGSALVILSTSGEPAKDTGSDVLACAQIEAD